MTESWFQQGTRGVDAAMIWFRVAGVRRVERTDIAFAAVVSGLAHATVALMTSPPPRGFMFKPVWLKTLVGGSIQEVFKNLTHVSFWDSGLRTI